jgi:hypothetical protein
MLVVALVQNTSILQLSSLVLGPTRSTASNSRLEPELVHLRRLRSCEQPFNHPPPRLTPEYGHTVVQRQRHLMVYHFLQRL